MLEDRFIQMRLKSAKLCSLSIDRGSVPEAFASYEDALKCSSSSGYQEVDLVKVVVMKTLRWRDELSRNKNLDFPSTQALLGLIAAHRGSRLRVIDFGGGLGIHYFETLAFMGRGSVFVGKFLKLSKWLTLPSLGSGTNTSSFFRVSVRLPKTSGEPTWT